MTKWTIDQIRNQFLIISQPRAGTQMLERALSTHPDVVMRTWSTSQDNHHPIMDLYQFREMDRQEGQRPFRGTVTHSWGEQFTKQTFGMGLERYWRTVGWFFPRVVLLTRANQLKRYLSYRISDQLCHWGVHNPRPGDPVIDLDFDEFLAWLHDTMAYWMAVLRAFPGALRLTYEELDRHWERTWIKILGFLGIPQRAIWPSTVRQESRPVREIIGNWGPELERKFKYYGLETWTL